MNREAYFEKIYQENVNFLLCVCKKRVNYQREYQELIEDCIQDTFLIAMNQYSIVVNHPNIRAWLVRTCLNRLLPKLKTQQRNQKFIVTGFDDSLVAGIDYVEQYLEKSLRRDCLVELEASLNDKENSIYSDYFIENKSMKNIASENNASENQIKNIIQRIRRKATGTFKKNFDSNASK